MKPLVMQLQYILNQRAFLIILLVINVLGTIYGYYWYQGQLEMTDPKYYIFVPDSPTASLFFCLAIVGWLLGRNFKLMEVLALVTLIKYGLWAVVMNLLTLLDTGYIGWMGWMLVASHFLMAVQAVLYLPKYRFELWHVIVAAIWTLHNDVIDYLFGQMPIYHVIDQYPSEIGYFTFWLSIACILLAFLESRKREYLQRL
ncbi:DUF1405 domain-containing protein [Lysinibacillus sp. 2017]|uniref:DUF1405 domain-containing protein n=1 Tax=unclassified Lysinibacillus TaxID=2636778 RepID=UPI000D525C67|nr:MULTISPECIES: DUF1405 domain-containing protein [unclassified Lysinibacillus]AWE07006.1 DUF1405 domain-containing protein [Lysinibacillus sp. 2017]TGN37070.1 DUF1405 domain-containing protein [Lysinibacillus sp. S2017]